ncbi:MAG TPA: LCP family protein [Candidatus Limnocylindrales bacterium]|jgi:LCP family protein required for cell wall assembly
MQSRSNGAPRRRSPFVAAFLSLLFPGLGHAYAGANQRALAFAALPILLLALAAGVVARVELRTLAVNLLLPGVLQGVFVANLIALVYRLVAIIDAWRVTAYLNAWYATGGRFDDRRGRPRLAFNPLSFAGLLAVILVMAGGHVAVARYDVLAMNTLGCIFLDPNAECQGASPSPDPSGSEEPIESDEPEPTVSLPPEGSALPNASIPPWNGTERLNILLIGADEQRGGHNTDTLIVLSVDPVTKQVAMFSLPRDTVDVPIPASAPNARRLFGSVYRGKINSFFINTRHRTDLFPGTAQTRGYNGIKALLGELYHIDIKYFVEVNFDGFTKIVDAFGGITVNVQVPVADNRFPGANGTLRRIYIPVGVQHMNGAQALVYARSRYSSNDYERGQRQQRVLLSLRQSVDIATILPRINVLAAALSEAVRTDIPQELVPQLLSLAESVDTKSLRSYVFAPPRYGTEGTRAGAGFIIVPNISRIRAAVAEAFTVDPEFEARRQALAAEEGTVWVLNASGETGQASRLAAYLDYVGMTVSAPNQPADPPSLSGTRITAYNGAETKMPVTVKTLEELLGVTVVTATDPTARADIVVTIGRTTPDLTPPPAP